MLGFESLQKWIRNDGMMESLNVLREAAIKSYFFSGPATKRRGGATTKEKGGGKGLSGRTTKKETFLRLP